MRKTKPNKKDRSSNPDGADPITGGDPGMDDMSIMPEPDDDPLIELELSDEAADLVRQLENERDDAIDARQRALADYRNFQRRSMENEQRAKQDGAVRVVRSVLPVLDHFDLALDQDTSSLNVEQLIGGVKIVRDELSKALEQHGVTRLEPEIGSEFDPNRHEAVTRMPGEGVAPNHIVAVMQPGYMLGEQVLRPAKVAVAPGNE